MRVYLYVCVLAASHSLSSRLRDNTLELLISSRSGEFDFNSSWTREMSFTQNLKEITGGKKKNNRKGAQSAETQTQIALSTLYPSYNNIGSGCPYQIASKSNKFKDKYMNKVKQIKNNLCKNPLCKNRK